MVADTLGFSAVAAKTAEFVGVVAVAVQPVRTSVVVSWPAIEGSAASAASAG